MGPSATFIGSQPLLAPRHNRPILYSPRRCPYSKPALVRPICCDGPTSSSQPPSSSSSSSSPPPPPSAPPPTPPSSPRTIPFLVPPKAAPQLLQRPEALLAVSVVGALSTAVFFKRAFSRILSSIAQRASNLVITRSQTARLQARRREADFLESALAATRATLANTRSRLEATQSTIRAVDETVAIAANLNDQLAHASQRRNAAAEQLAQLERNLRDGRIELATQTALAKQARLAADAARARRDGCIAGMANAESELRVVEAERAENAAQVLAADVAARGDALCELERQRDIATSTLELRAAEVERGRGGVDATLAEVQAGRAAIDQLADRAMKLDTDTARRRQAVQMSARETGAVEDLEKVVSNVEREQQEARKMLEEVRARETEKAKEREELRREIAARDERLAQIRTESDIPLSEKSSVRVEELVQDADNPAHNVNVEEAVKKEVGRDEVIAAATGTAVTDDTSASENGNNLQGANSPHGEVATTLLTAQSTPTVAAVEDAPKPKPRKRGRPRKTESEATSAEAKPKRGRGRPRKTESVSTDEDAAKPVKAKRGRPRKVVEP